MTMLEEVSLGAGFLKLCHLNSHSAYWLSEVRDASSILSVAVAVLACCHAFLVCQQWTLSLSGMVTPE